MLVCTLEPSCFLFGRISSARKSAKMSLITRSGETGCCVTVIYFKSEPGSLDARFAGCFGGRPRLALIFTFYFHFTIGRIDYNGVGVRRIENGLI